MDSIKEVEKNRENRKGIISDIQKEIEKTKSKIQELKNINPWIDIANEIDEKLN